MILLATPARGDSLSKLIRQASRLADDIPIGQLDDVAEQIARKRLGREALEAELKTTGRISKSGDDVARSAARSAEAARWIKAAVPGGLDPKLTRWVNDLDQPAREAAAVLARGGKAIDQAVPDLIARTRLVAAGGAETIAAAGLADNLVKDAVRIDTAIRSGAMIIPPGVRSITLRDFGKLMIDQGKPAQQFWEKYVRPHWKTWMAGGAMAAYLADPETFMDIAGNLTEAGSQRLTALLGAATARVITGITAGTQQSIDSVSKSLVDAGRDTLGGLLVSGLIMLTALSLTFYRLRGRLCRLKQSSSSTLESKKQPQDQDRKI